MKLGPDYSDDLKAALAAAYRVLEKLQPGESVSLGRSGISIRVETPEAVAERKEAATKTVMELMD